MRGRARAGSRRLRRDFEEQPPRLAGGLGWRRRVPDRTVERDEISAGAGEPARRLDRLGVGDAGGLEDFRPPGDALDEQLQRHRRDGAARLAEHHVVGAHFACGHRLVAHPKRAGADDSLRLQALERLLERFPRAGHVDAVGASLVASRASFSRSSAQSAATAAFRSGATIAFASPSAPGASLTRALAADAAARTSAKVRANAPALAVESGGVMRVSEQGGGEDGMGGDSLEEAAISPTNAAKTGIMASPSERVAVGSVRTDPSRPTPNQLENAARRRSCCRATSQCRPTGSGERAIARLRSRWMTRSWMRSERQPRPRRVAGS